MSDDPVLVANKRLQDAKADLDAITPAAWSRPLPIGTTLYVPAPDGYGGDAVAEMQAAWPHYRRTAHPHLAQS